jgi:hypothetical protein
MDTEQEQAQSTQERYRGGGVHGLCLSVDSTFQMLNKTASRKFSRQATIKTNPKFEYRNPKQTQQQKPPIGKIQNAESEGSWFGISHTLII